MVTLSNEHYDIISRLGPICDPKSYKKCWIKWRKIIFSLLLGKYTVAMETTENTCLKHSIMFGLKLTRFSWLCSQIYYLVQSDVLNSSDHSFFNILTFFSKTQLVSMATKDVSKIKFSKCFYYFRIVIIQTWYVENFKLIWCKIR